MKNISFIALILIITGTMLSTRPILAQTDENGVPLNILSQAEKLSGWKLLWDGKTTKGWHGTRIDHFPTKGWSMADGILTVDKSSGKESAHGGDIVTDKEYSQFELSLEFKLTPGANSGIKYHVFPKQPKQKGSGIGLEYQLLDDARHPDAKKGVGGNRTLASLYDLIPAENKAPQPIGKWNHARIISYNDGRVEHWLNGKKVLEYNRFSQAFRALVQKSKFVGYKDFGQIKGGLILLQEHGHEVHFRNIKIREF